MPIAALFTRIVCSVADPLLAPRRRLLRLLLVGAFVFLLAGCSSATPPAAPHAQVPTPTAPPTATALPKGTVLFQADWSHGLTGWQSTAGWQVVQGQLVSDGSKDASVTVPYRPTVSNYAVEARIQVVSLVQKNGGSFDIWAKQATGKDGYQAGVSDIKGEFARPSGDHAQAQIFIEPMSSMSSVGDFRPVDYEPHLVWHTYRIEVQDNQASFFIDDVPETDTVSSTKTPNLSEGPISLDCSMVVLHVSSVRITSL